MMCAKLFVFRLYSPERNYRKKYYNYLPENIHSIKIKGGFVKWHYVSGHKEIDRKTQEIQIVLIIDAYLTYKYSHGKSYIKVVLNIVFVIFSSHMKQVTHNVCFQDTVDVANIVCFYMLNFRLRNFVFGRIDSIRLQYTYFQTYFSLFIFIFISIYTVCRLHTTNLVSYSLCVEW